MIRRPALYLAPILALCLSAAATHDAAARSRWDLFRRGASGYDLRPDLPSGQTVGTPIVWTVTTPDDAAHDHRYLVLGLPGGVSVAHDFTPRSQLGWTPLDEGIYVVIVASRNRTMGTAHLQVRPYRVTGPEGSPVVLPTEHPLVALYSAEHRFGSERRPARAHEMRVVFQAVDDGRVQATHAKPIHPGLSTSFYVAGMRGETRYALRHEILDRQGNVVERGPVLFHTTGAAGFESPASAVRIPRDDVLDSIEPMLLFSPILTLDVPYATDLAARLVWYDPRQIPATLTRSTDQGRILVLVQDAEDRGLKTLQEVDLVGSVIRETTVARVNEQLAEIGQDPIATFHHEVRRLPNGRTAVLGLVVREFEGGMRGPEPATLVGDNLMVFDEAMRLEWVWNAFEHLDVTRPPPLGETCVGGRPGCNGTPSGIVAEDWTHSNAIDYSPADGNLIVSVRNQDWIVKIDYADGAGTGRVLWRLGLDGDFSIDSNLLFPWHSHAHDPAWTSNGRITVYDNGNTRCAAGAGCQSRGQVYEIDEEAMTARLVENAGLDVFSFAFGSSHGLRDGGFHFGTGISAQGGRAEEVRSGETTYSLTQETLMYRSYRMRDLYSPPPGSVAEGELPPPEPVF